MMLVLRTLSRTMSILYVLAAVAWVVKTANIATWTDFLIVAVLSWAAAVAWEFTDLLGVEQKGDAK